MKISLDKEYRTRRGHKVRLYAIDGLGTNPVHGARLINGIWEQTSWRRNGAYYADSQYRLDLVEVKSRIKRTVWLNVYESFTHVHGSLASAKRCGGETILLRKEITIECEEGEGLEDE